MSTAICVQDYFEPNLIGACIKKTIIEKVNAVTDEAFHLLLWWPTL